MKRWMLGSISVVLCLAFGAVAFGQDAEEAAPAVTIDQLVEAGQKSLKEAKSVSADVAMTQEATKLKGTFLVLRPDNMKMELTATDEDASVMKMKMFMSAGMMFSEITQGPMRMVTSIDMNKVRQAAEKAGVDSGLNFGASDFTEMLTGLQKQGYKLTVVDVKDDLATVVADPAGKTQLGQPLAKMILVTNIKDGLPRKVKTVQRGMNSTIELSNYKFNVEAKAEDFKYEAPEGVQLMDMTPMILNAIEMQAGQKKQPAEDAKDQAEQEKQPAEDEKDSDE